MASTDRLDALREQNKDLLRQLKLQREKMSGCSQSHKREREDEAEEAVVRSGGQQASARAALHRLRVKFADPCKKQVDTVSSSSLTSKPREGSVKHLDTSENFNDRERHTEVQDRPQDTSPINHSKEQREVQSRVMFQSHRHEEIPACDRHHVRPLLGYDWIAGVLDAEDSLIERSDEFFNDLRRFRTLHKDECVHSPQAEFSEVNDSGLGMLTDKDDPETNKDTHQCTFSYRINSRLFPVPLHSQECCPVCKKHKSFHPHTTDEPALIRVSIPRSTLLPPYEYKAHRRCSFDPSDSLGLASHCLSGWLHTGQSTLLPPSCLDLQSCLDKKNSAELQNKEVEHLFLPTVSSDQTSNHISNVSRLARHNFHRFSPSKNTRKYILTSLLTNQPSKSIFK